MHSAENSNLNNSLLDLLFKVGAISHQATANMLGVRREGATQVMASLRQEGIIATARGSVRIVNRPALIGKSCECYSAIRKEYRRLFLQHTYEPER